eukprot:scaffold7643_cov267-Pinguiococcus_pyrenoidosus.AAC.4
MDPQGRSRRVERGGRRVPCEQGDARAGGATPGQHPGLHSAHFVLGRPRAPQFRHEGLEEVRRLQRRG